MTKPRKQMSFRRPKRVIVSREEALERMSRFPERMESMIAAIKKAPSKQNKK